MLKGLSMNEGQKLKLKYTIQTILLFISCLLVLYFKPFDKVYINWLLGVGVGVFGFITLIGVCLANSHVEKKD